jgi:DNA-binding response OmpR family regulator
MHFPPILQVQYTSPLALLFDAARCEWYTPCEGSPVPAPWKPDPAMQSQPQTQRILVVDDDPAILHLVCDKFEREGFEVLTAGSGQAALDLVGRAGLPHLAIVDLNMPGMDGFEFCRRVLGFCDLPIVILTAVDEEETVIQAIDLFAEDYVTKPFSPRELVARVRRVLRRIGDFAYCLAPVTRVDERLAVDFVGQQAFVGDQPVDLSPTEAKILYLLMRQAGRSIPSEYLLQRVWPLEEVFEDTLRVNVHRLRKKIGNNPAGLPYIVTERGVGYSFLPDG